MKGVDKKMKKRILSLMDKGIVRKAKKMVDKSKSRSPTNSMFSPNAASGSGNLQQLNIKLQ